MTSSVLGNLATDWAKARKAQGQKQLLRCHQPLLVLWPMFCSNGFCTGWLTKKNMAIRITFRPDNQCNRGARDPSMWWGSAIQSFYLRFVSSPLGFASKSRSVCPHTSSGNDPGASFVSCTEGPAHESWIMKLTRCRKMTICFPWQLIFFDHCRVRLWSDQQVDSFDITLAVLGQQHELCNLLKGKILSLKRWYFCVQHFDTFWNQRLLHFKTCFASSRQWPSHTLWVPSNAVVTVTPTREAKHLRSQPQSTFHQNQTKWVFSQWRSISIISLRHWPDFLDLLAATLQLPLFEESWSVSCDAKTKTQKASFASLVKTNDVLMDIHGTGHHCFGAKWMHLCSLDVLEPLPEPHPQFQKWQ